ncbi:MAG: polyribonucleotide nucleotidyltransferase [Phycisphaerales bacterium]|nr:MAG: polyribonucleotide nucleotidyltransferase [Phycisphaerales bacterium]
MEPITVERQIGAAKLRFETGKLAKQAAGSVLITYGDTVVLSAVVTSEPRPGIDFFPLTVDYREKIYAAGKFPGGFFKREGRPTGKEIVTMRNIDRPIRPLFPTGFKDEVLIQAMVLSADPENDSDILGINASSAALSISQIPFDGPMAAVRVGRVNGKLVVNPTFEQLEYGDLDMVLAGHNEGVSMIEVGAQQLEESVVADAVEFGHTYIKQICEMIDELVDRCGKEKKWTPPPSTEELKIRAAEKIRSRLREAKNIKGKLERNEAVQAIIDEAVEELCPPDVEEPEFDANVVRAVLNEIEEDVVQEMVVREGIRPDGRGLRDIRPIWCEVAVLPRTHGSALFTRGETQALVAATLGTSRDEQIVDGLQEEYSKKFMLHYNFPPISVGEVKRVGAVTRREIGHGALAERSLEAVLPSPERFPYTVRLVSDIMESNGSSSMASVCGGTLALMDAGVPISQPVAGISIGRMHRGEQSTLIVDILGEEDHFGDMDFKVAGTQRGITGIQLDLKVRGLSYQEIRETLDVAKDARMSILRDILRTIQRPRPDISVYAPRILTIKIDPEKIGKVIGPAGKGIRGIEADTGAKVEIEDDGTINISSLGGYGPAEKARAMIEAITEEVKVGRIYTGRVTSVKDFGAFIEVTPGQDGMCHISELSEDYVQQVSDVCKVGDIMKVKVLLIDEQGRIKLSRKAALRDERHTAKPRR